VVAAASAISLSGMLSEAARSGPGRPHLRFLSAGGVKLEPGGRGETRAGILSRDLAPSGRPGTCWSLGGGYFDHHQPRIRYEVLGFERKVECLERSCNAEQRCHAHDV